MWKHRLLEYFTAGRDSFKFHSSFPSLLNFVPCVATRQFVWRVAEDTAVLSSSPAGIRMVLLKLFMLTCPFLCSSLPQRWQEAKLSQKALSKVCKELVRYDFEEPPLKRLTGHTQVCFSVIYFCFEFLVRNVWGIVVSPAVENLDI